MIKKVHPFHFTIENVIRRFNSMIHIQEEK